MFESLFLPFCSPGRSFAFPPVAAEIIGSRTGVAGQGMSTKGLSLISRSDIRLSGEVQTCLGFERYKSGIYCALTVWAVSHKTRKGLAVETQYFDRFDKHWSWGM